MKWCKHNCIYTTCTKITLWTKFSRGFRLFIKKLKMARKTFFVYFFKSFNYNTWIECIYADMSQIYTIQLKCSRFFRLIWSESLHFFFFCLELSFTLYSRIKCAASVCEYVTRNMFKWHIRISLKYITVIKSLIFDGGGGGCCKFLN